jgi:hypothetical protein
MFHKGRSPEASKDMISVRQHLSDEGVAALLGAEAAKRGGRFVIELVDGHWRAGFAVSNGLGEIVIQQATYGPNPANAMRKLLGRAAESPQAPVDDPPAVDDRGFKDDDALLMVREILGLELATEIRLHPAYEHNESRTVRVRVRCMPPDRVSAPIELVKVAARWEAEIIVDDGWFVFRPAIGDSEDERCQVGHFRTNPARAALG